MRKALLLTSSIFLFISLAGCNNNVKQNIYGIYTFEEVSYLSGLSSTTKGYVEDEMKGTKYIVKADLFKIESANSKIEISSPNYVREEIPDNVTLLSDVRSFISKNIECQYTIYTKDGSTTHWRIYVSSDSLWISSFVDNTADGSEIIMNIFKVSK